MKKKHYKTRSGSSKAKGTTTPVGDLAEEVTYVSVARAKAKGSTPSSKGSSKGTPLPTLPTDPKDYDKKMPAKDTTSYHTPVPDPPITPTRIDGRLTSTEAGSTTTKSTSKRKPSKKPKVSSPPRLNQSFSPLLLMIGMKKILGLALAQSLNHSPSIWTY